MSFNSNFFRQVELEGDQVIVEAFHGPGAIGYAALDQIHETVDGAATNCETVPDEAAMPTTTTPPTTATPSSRFPACNFEEGTCGWFSSADANLMWRWGTANEFGDTVPHPPGDMADDPNGMCRSSSTLKAQCHDIFDFNFFVT